MKKGVFCLSIDTELLWGRRGANLENFIPQVKKEREIIKEILKLFKKYKVPATWALVGQLFKEGDPLWHGKDIIETILKEKNQEIASHSFSHLIFRDKNTSQKEVEKDLKKWIEAAYEFNVKPFSFIFPKNSLCYLDLLRKYGFCCFRGQRLNFLNHKPFQIISYLFSLSPPVFAPTVDKHGLVNIPASMYFVSARGLRKFIPITNRVIRAQKGIERAAREKKVFHLWFHPVDFALQTRKMLSAFEEILVLAAELRTEGLLEIKTMTQIAKDHLLTK